MGGEGQRGTCELFGMGVPFDVAGEVFRAYSQQSSDAHDADLTAAHQKGGIGAADVQPFGDFEAVEEAFIHSLVFSRSGRVHHEIII